MTGERKGLRWRKERYKDQEHSETKFRARGTVGSEDHVWSESDVSMSKYPASEPLTLLLIR